MQPRRADFFLAAALGIRRLAAEQKVGGHELGISSNFRGGGGGRQPEEYLMQPRRADLFLAAALGIRRLAAEQKVGGH